jgi:hypothetical protein
MNFAEQFVITTTRTAVLVESLEDGRQYPILEVEVFNVQDNTVLLLHVWDSILWLNGSAINQMKRSYPR